VQTYLANALAGRRDLKDREVYVSRLVVRGAAGETTSFRSGEEAWVDVEIAARAACERLSVTLFVQDESSVGVFNTSTERLGLGTFDLLAGGAFRCSIQLNLHLAPGTFYVGAAIVRYDIQREYDRWLPAATLLISADKDIRGIANLAPRVVTFEPVAGPQAPNAL